MAMLYEDITIFFEYQSTKVKNSSLQGRVSKTSKGLKYVKKQSNAFSYEKTKWYTIVR